MHARLDPRELRGREIAETMKLIQTGSAWIVPSQSGKGRYTVCSDGQTPHCTCPDHETRGVKCKHIYAVEYAISRERDCDGNTTAITETVTVSHMVKRTYPQNWSAYNAAQTHEKELFLDLLHDLCAGVTELERPKTGCPRLPIQDGIFAACYKVYSTVSARRFMSDLRDATAKGYLSRLPHFNSIFNYLENPDLTPILREMITETSLPLKAVETDFAVDSSGFTTSRFIRWFDHTHERNHDPPPPCRTGLRSDLVRHYKRSAPAEHTADPRRARGGLRRLPPAGTASAAAASQSWTGARRPAPGFDRLTAGRRIRAQPL